MDIFVSKLPFQCKFYRPETFAGASNSLTTYNKIPWIDNAETESIARILYQILHWKNISSKKDVY